MIRKVQIALVMFFLVLSGIVYAGEGIWIPLLLNELNSDDLKASGLQLSPEELYSVNNSSLKDAVVSFGGFCTAEVVSREGLIFTNHHCGYGQIQDISINSGKDYLTDGYWAMRGKEELPCKGLTATFIVRIEDVTKKVLEGVVGYESAEAQLRIRENMEALKKKATEGTYYDAVIKPFFYGNEYYMFITETYRDVRLVGAPPSSIGKYGGDTDNWMWPRHTGDFSVFRIYAGPDNKPAAYSEKNVPYKPKYYFPVSIEGYKEGDFTMVYGFPGRTSEYLTSHAVNLIQNASNPVKIKIREARLDIFDTDMKLDKMVKIKYAAKQSGVSNAYKKWIGQTRGLKKMDAIGQKKDLEEKFAEWVNEDQYRGEKYGSLLYQFEEAYKDFDKYQVAFDYYVEAARGIEVLSFADRFRRLTELCAIDTINENIIENELNRLISGKDNFFKNYNPPTDKKVFVKLLAMYRDGVDSSLIGDALAEVDKKYKGNFQKLADKVFKKSVFASEENFDKFFGSFKKSSYKKILKDPAFALNDKLRNNFIALVYPVYLQTDSKTETLTRRYIAAIREMQKDKKFYPDANGTLRLAYGKVGAIEPRDGMIYKYYTTLDGVIEKHDPDNPDFQLPEKLIQLHKDKDYGRYVSDSTVMTCFLASNHTTGGNSGSPVLNAQGQLIGINFDRNWEGTMSDIMYDPSQCRNISVDIRYVLFIIDKLAGAGHLLDEMWIIE